MKQKILVHICCGICAIKTFEHLENDFETTGYWYNPNIQPYSEYKIRLQAAGYVFQRIKKEIEWNTSYDLFDWFDVIMPYMKDKKNRCRACYEFRLEKTAQYARKNSIKVFTTTMFISIHQDLQAIEEAGKLVAKKYQIEFLPLDLRKCYQEGKKEAKKLNIYSQRYCGCIFSEIEREEN